jgi:hypothetical protein
MPWPAADSRILVGMAPVFFGQNPGRYHVHLVRDYSGGDWFGGEGCIHGGTPASGISPVDFPAG